MVMPLFLFMSSSHLSDTTSALAKKSNRTDKTDNRLKANKFDSQIAQLHV